MSHQVIWTKEILDTFINDACLTPEEEMIMRTRVKGWTISKQAQELHMSESNVKRIISILKKKYDAVQKNNSVLPKRRTSKIEEYLDTH